MEAHVSGIIGHMVKTHHEMARIMEAKKQVARRLSEVISGIPGDHSFDSVHDLQENSIEITKNVTAYLNSLAALEEAIGDNLEVIMRELAEGQEE